MNKQVLTIGLIPELVDFSTIPHLNAEKVRAGLDADRRALIAAGYQAHQLLIDLGETAEAVVVEQLAATTFDCILIGAGIRTLPAHFLLFEKLINLIHGHAPKAKICFNTNPSDTAASMQRWA